MSCYSTRKSASDKLVGLCFEFICAVLLDKPTLQDSRDKIDGVNDCPKNCLCSKKIVANYKVRSVRCGCELCGCVRGVHVVIHECTVRCVM